MGIKDDHRVLDYLKAVFEIARYGHPSAMNTPEHERRANCEEMALIVFRDMQKNRVEITVESGAVRRLNRKIDKISQNGQTELSMKDLIRLEKGRRR